MRFENDAQRGALTPEMLRDLASALRTAAACFPDVRVLILRGSDSYFSSGYAIDRIPDPDQLAVKDEIEQLCETIEESPLVVVARLTGLVIGAALDISAACDLRFASRECRFGITPARLGLVYSVYGTARILRLVGSAAARRLLFTGELVSADEALVMGLLHAVASDSAELDVRLADVAGTVASRAPLSLRGTKAMLRALEKPELPPVLERSLHELRTLALSSHDAEEARIAFQEKRSPVFTGRGALS